MKTCQAVPAYNSRKTPGCRVVLPGVSLQGGWITVCREHGGGEQAPVPGMQWEQFPGLHTLTLCSSSSGSESPPVLKRRNKGTKVEMMDITSFFHGLFDSGCRVATGTAVPWCCLAPTATAKPSLIPEWSLAPKSVPGATRGSFVPLPREGSWREHLAVLSRSVFGFQGMCCPQPTWGCPAPWSPGSPPSPPT